MGYNDAGIMVLSESTRDMQRKQEKDMAMRCPKCENEIGPDEAFCGQCGTPVSSPAQPTEMVYTPHSGQLNSYNVNNGNRQLAPGSTYAQNSAMLPPLPPVPRQQTNFYQDATEAMTSLPNNNLPSGYQ